MTTKELIERLRAMKSGTFDIDTLDAIADRLAELDAVVEEHRWVELRARRLLIGACLMQPDGILRISDTAMALAADRHTIERVRDESRQCECFTAPCTSIPTALAASATGKGASNG